MRRPNDDDEALALSRTAHTATRVLQLEGPVMTLETATTADGVRLALKRLSPRQPQPGRSPVILCHGLAGNATIFDAGRQDSLAWTLVRHGHPVWLVNLRGAGESDRPPRGWCLDDLIHKDVPAVIHHVRQAHGGDITRVHWVGHSLGGIVILCALATATPSLQPYIQTVTTLGSALDYEESAWKRFAPLVPITRLIPNGDKVVLPDTLNTALLSILQVYPYFLCANKIEKESLAVLEQCLEPVSLGVMQHLATAIQPGGLAVHPPTGAAVAPTAAPQEGAMTPAATKIDSPRNVVAPAAADTVPVPVASAPSPRHHQRQQQRYLQILGRVKTPVLAVCGDRDVQCGEAAVLRMMGALGSVRRRFVLVGDGEVSSYGHMDLLLKPSAGVDVFPYVCEWVAAAEAGGWGPEEFRGEEAATLLEELKVADSDDGDGRRCRGGLERAGSWSVELG